MIAGDGSSSHGLSPAAMDAIGYTGGCVLAICLIPQIGKIVITRSARDISYAWSVLYLIGTVLSLVYLVMKDAMAAWIPLVIEIAGCMTVIFLKTMFEHTPAGRKWSVAKQQQQLQTALSERFSQLDASVQSLPGISHCISIQGAAAAEVEGSVRALAAELSASKHGIPHPHLEVTCNSADASHFATSAAAALAAAAAAANAHSPVFPGSGRAASPRQQQQQQHADGLFAGGWAGLQPVYPLQQQQPPVSPGRLPRF